MKANPSGSSVAMKMGIFSWCLVSLLAQSLPARAAEPGVAAETAPAPPFPLSAYAAMRSSFAQSNRLHELGWSDAQAAAFLDGLRAALQGKPLPFDEAAAQVSNEMRRRVQALAQRAAPPSAASVQPPVSLEAYLRDASKRLGLQQADSGLAYRVEVGRGGPRPRPVDSVVFSCVATEADGKTSVPALSSERVNVAMSELLPGFREVLQMMTVGSVAVFVLPPALSFGDGEWPPGVERGSPLIIQLTLFEVISADASR